jgi:hypothetical protein
MKKKKVNGNSTIWAKRCKKCGKVIRDWNLAELCSYHRSQQKDWLRRKNGKSTL